MRYLKLIAILAVLIWTNYAFTCKEGQSYKTHQKIQAELVQLMNDAIIQAVPNAENIECEKMWTKEAAKNSIEAFFSCYFNQPEGQKARLGMEGSAKLSLNTQATSEEWTLDFIDINNEVYKFEEPVVIEVKQ